MVTTSCGSGGSSTLRTSRIVVPPGGSGVATRIAVAGFSLVGRAYGVGSHGSLYLTAPGSGFRLVGSVPSPDSSTGTGYEADFGLSVDPTDPATLYVDSDALYVSEDSGRTWHGTVRNAGGSWAGGIFAYGSFVYAIRAPGHLECGTCTPDPGGWRLYQSIDHGRVWHLVARYDTNEIWGLLPAPNRSPGSLFVETSSGLFLHTPGRDDLERDSGIQRSYGYPPSTVLLAASGATGALYAATSDGDNSLARQVFVSNDEGRHWHLRRSPFHGDQGALLGDLRHPGTAYAIVNMTRTRGNVDSTIGGYASKVFVTHDSANSWREIWHGCLRGSSFLQTPAELIPGDPNTILVQRCNGHLSEVS
jgi:hypothetical protein